MATILEALENARHNLTSGFIPGVEIGKIQLNNAITLLEKGYGCHTDIEETIEQYGTLEQVPDIN